MLRSVALATVLTALAAFAPAQKLTFDKYVLPNGMTVVLHEDHSLPVVAVEVWYKVGSKDEPARRSGFAHLFEHLMFMGTKRVPNGRFDAIMEAQGGSNNASTAEDRTEFHESGPSNLLPTLLWLESDRLETLGRDIDQKKLDLQRDVVKNERRQNTENTPYGSAYEAINGLLFPANHPYGHSVIGSMADLDAASVADVQNFFASYYVPNNAILSIAGDFKPDETKALVAKLFGTLPRKDDPPRPVAPTFDFQTKRVTLTDRVTQPKVIMVWHSPAYFAPGDAEMDLVASALGDGVSSRLYRRLVSEDKLATDVNVGQESRALGSLFTIDVSAVEGADLSKIEAAIDDELAKLKRTGPTDAELNRARAQTEVGIAAVVQSDARLAEDLAQYEYYLGDPDGFQRQLADVRAVTPTRARDEARQVLDENRRLILRVVPATEAEQGANPRDTPPAIGPAAPFAAPAPVEFTLSNGLKVHYWQRKGVPLVSLALLSRHGAGEDPSAKAGATSLMTDLLSDGAGSRDAETFETELEAMGASFDADATARNTTVGLTVLERNLDRALPIFVDALSSPRFDADEIEREKRVRIAAIQQGEQDPGDLADKVAREAYFGSDSPLGRPVDGTVASVSSLTKEDLKAAYRRSLGPAATELFAAGGLEPDALKAQLEKTVGTWKADATPASAPLAAVPTKPFRVLVVSRRGSVQTNVRYIFPAPPLGDTNRAAVQSAATALGGSFTSRLMQNLREDKGYTYGAGAGYVALPGVGFVRVSADVRSDATEPALKEFAKEFERIRGGDVTAAEIAKSAQLRRAAAIESLGTLSGLLELATSYASNGQTLASLGDDLASLSGLDPAKVNAATKLAVENDRGVLVLVGDPDVIAKALTDAGLPKGEVVKG